MVGLLQKALLTMLSQYLKDLDMAVFRIFYNNKNHIVAEADFFAFLHTRIVGRMVGTHARFSVSPRCTIHTPASHDTSRRHGRHPCPPDKPMRFCILSKLTFSGSCITIHIIFALFPKQTPSGRTLGHARKGHTPPSLRILCSGILCRHQADGFYTHEQKAEDEKPGAFKLLCSTRLAFSRGKAIL